MTSRHRIFVSKDVLKFSSAHMTVFPDGTKERLHGHNFQVLLEFELHTMKLASLLDFGLVKQTLAQVCARWISGCCSARAAPPSSW